MRGRTINTQEPSKINSAKSIKGTQDLTPKGDAWGKKKKKKKAFSVGPFQKVSIYRYRYIYILIIYGISSRIYHIHKKPKHNVLFFWHYSSIRNRIATTSAL